MKSFTIDYKLKLSRFKILPTFGQIVNELFVLFKLSGCLTVQKVFDFFNILTCKQLCDLCKVLNHVLEHVACFFLKELFD